MQLVFDDGAKRREYDVQVNNPSATVADLAHALDPKGSGERPLLIGDEQPDPDLPFREAGVHEGAVLQFGRPGRTVPWLQAGNGPQLHQGVAGTNGSGNVGAPEQELAVVNGADSGRRFRLLPGLAIIGRAPSSDIQLAHTSVSKHHAQLEVTADGEVTITDLGSHNGTWIGDDPVTEPTPLEEGARFRIGALELEVRPVDETDRPVAIDPARQATAAGTVPFNRPPRPALPPPHDEIEPPKPPDKEQRKQPFSLIRIFTPMVFGVTMYLVMGSIFFLLFCLMSPIMMIGNFIASRRQGKKRAKQEKARYKKELEEFVAALDEVGAVERERRAVGYPDPAEVVRRAQLPTTTLWERRPDHADFLKLRAGIGDTFWDPPIPKRSGAKKPPEELAEAMEKAKRLPAAPVLADLAEGGVVGIVGHRDAAVALARSLLCQAAVFHGPTDLPVMVLAHSDHAQAWDWAKWLPHVRDSSGSGRRLSYDSGLSTKMADGPVKAAKAKASERGGSLQLGGSSKKPATGPTLLVVVDDESLTKGRRAPTRNLLRGEAGLVAGIVIAEVADRLPAMVTTIVEMTGPSGEAHLIRPQQGERTDGLLTCGVSDIVARDCARALARFEDPELEIVGAGLPATVRLLPLLEMDECTPETILARWRSAGLDPSPAGPIGVTEDDIFSIDFLTDGPHGLVGGTTGAGKSELLRTMVAGMAATVDPDHLTFVLVDFKGGSAFDQCALLPHTVGMVTDLDEHLAERALRCLEAELKYREKALRAAGASDLPDYLKNRKGAQPLPRLVVIIDEFATLKADLPDFVDALVGVAQRGRSLGVHMLLATQRPQGAINDNIKANTNMRIALRMQDKTDSGDVLGLPDAADIPRSAPGRAYVRLGPGEIVAIQTALSTGSREEGTVAPVEVAPFVYGPKPRLASPAPPSVPLPPPVAATDGDVVEDHERPAGPQDAGTAALDEAQNGPATPSPDANSGRVEEETDLSVLVETINVAFEQSGRPAPRRPWPDELPRELDLDELMDQAISGAPPGGRLSFVPVALADDPEAQAQYPVGWTPDDGNLLLYGIVGSGTTTALSSLALALTRLYEPDQLHLYVMDFGAGELEPLAQLPHCGGVVVASERERQQRVIRILRDELNRRRDLPARARSELPMIVTMLDGWSTFVGDYQDYSGQELLDVVTRIISDGPEVGLYTIIATDRPTGISQKITATVRQRWVFRLAEKADYHGAAGISSKAVPNMIPGHALVAETKQLVHVARPPGELPAAVAGRQQQATEPAPARRPAEIRTLPTEVLWSALCSTPTLDDRPWRIPVGIAEADLQPCSLTAYEGEHALIAGPSRSGRSSTLLAIAEAVAATEPQCFVAAVASRRSPLSTDPRMNEVVTPDRVLDELARLTGTDAPVVVLLFDDAETIDDNREKVLEKLSTSQQENLLVVAAGRSDVLRSSYQHWTRSLRRSKLGVLLNPNPDVEGELLGAKLPRRTPVPMTAGRGYVVTTEGAKLAQLALPTGPQR